MPTYEYRCDACKVEFEKEQRITEDRLKRCPKCGKHKLVRLVGTGHFVLKGGGWYKDLYASVPKSSKKSDGESSSATSDGGGGSSAKAGGDKPSGDKADAGKSGGEKATGDKPSASAPGKSKDKASRK